MLKGRPLSVPLFLTASIFPAPQAWLLVKPRPCIEGHWRPLTPTLKQHSTLITLKLETPSKAFEYKLYYQAIPGMDGDPGRGGLLKHKKIA